MAAEGGTIVSAAGGTFETVLGGTIKPLLSYDGDYSKTLDDFLTATLKERGQVRTVSEPLRLISENISKHVQVSSKNSNFFVVYFMTFSRRGLPNGTLYLTYKFFQFCIDFCTKEYKSQQNNSGNLEKKRRITIFATEKRINGQIIIVYYAHDKLSRYPL